MNSLRHRTPVGGARFAAPRFLLMIAMLLAAAAARAEAALELRHQWRSVSVVMPAEESREVVPGASALAPPRKSARAIAVSADGTTFIATRRSAWLTRDRGRSWTRIQGLPNSARVIADPIDDRKFYALDILNARIVGSDDGAAHFAALASRGLPQAFARNCVAQNGPHSPLVATPGRSDDAAASWSHINDAEHEYGRRFRVIAGDPRVFGRVYLGTDGRGILYGEPAT
jgi:xyloglucan-specific exo-beta-1,4-glucanase